MTFNMQNHTSYPAMRSWRNANMNSRRGKRPYRALRRHEKRYYPASPPQAPPIVLQTTRCIEEEDGGRMLFWRNRWSISMGHLSRGANTWAAELLGHIGLTITKCFSDIYVINFNSFPFRVFR